MEEKGVWRTIKGRRVFIREGEDLMSAMKRSGKFDNLNNKQRTVIYNKQSMIEAQNKIHKQFKNEGLLDEDEYYSRIGKEYAKIENRAYDDIDIRQQRRAITKELKENNSYNKFVKKLEEKESIESLKREQAVNTLKRGFKNISDEQARNYESKLEKLSFREQMTKADTWDDIHKSIDSIDNNYIKENLKRSAQKLEEAENGPWKSANYLDKEYVFYEGEYKRDRENYNKKYNSVSEAIADRDSKLNRYINSKTPLEKMNRQQLAEYIVDDQISRGIVKEENRTMQVQGRLKGMGASKSMSKKELYLGAKDTQLSKMSLSELRKEAQKYNIDITGLNAQKIRAKLIAIFK